MNINQGKLAPEVQIIDLNDAAAEEVARFVEAHPDSTVFHRLEWARAVEKACGHKTRILCVRDAEGEVAGVLPLTHVKSPLFGAALVSTGFAVDGGILASDGQAIASLAKAAQTWSADSGNLPIEMRGGAVPNGWDVDSETYLGFARPLAKDDEAELLAIPRKQRAEVRRAMGFELEMENGSSKSDRDAHYAVYSESVRNLGTPVFPRALFEAVLDEFGDDADILTVRHKGRAIASVLSLYHRGVVMPYWGGGTADARTWRANDMMYYALMLHARSKKGCHSFDFGRSKAGTGPASFKKNWGFEGEPLSYAHFAPDGKAKREVNPLNPKYQLKIKIWKKLPLPIANLIGPMIAKGLG